MSSSIPPDHSEKYYRPGSDHKLVVDFYDEDPTVVNWYQLFDDGSIGEAGTCFVSEINEEINTGGWSKLE